MSLMVAASLALLYGAQGSDQKIPSWVSNPTYASESSGGNGKIRLTFKEKPKMAGYKVVVQAYFDLDDGASLFDRNVTAVLNGMAYYSKPGLAPGMAGVVDETTFKKLGDASLAWNGKELTITYPKSLVANTDPIYVRIYCTPTTLDPSKVDAGRKPFMRTAYETAQARRRPTEPKGPETLKPPFAAMRNGTQIFIDSPVIIDPATPPR